MTSRISACRYQAHSLRIPYPYYLKAVMVTILLFAKISYSLTLFSSIRRFSSYAGIYKAVTRTSGIAAVGRSQDIRCVTWRANRNRVLMSPMEREDQSRNSQQIQFLLTKAANIVSKMTSTKERNANNSGSADEVKISKKVESSIPLSLSFSSQHKHSISLRDPPAALKYLTLPVEAYSVLDSNLVERSLTAHDTFILSLPLGDLTSASTLATGGGSGIQLAATLRTEVSVKPDPDKGRVVMESGPIYFIPTVDPQKGITDTVSSKLDTSETPLPAEFSDALPEWLLWGGKTAYATSSVTEMNDFSGRNEGEGVQSKIDAPYEKDSVVKSSIQARFRIELQWNSQESSGKNRMTGISNLFARANGLRNSFFASKEPLSSEVEPIIASQEAKEISRDVVDDGDIDGAPTSYVSLESPNFSGRNVEKALNEEEYLPVSAVVKVWVDVNLPLQADLSNALSFPPVRLLLNQAGSLTTKAVLSTVAPVLAKLLSSDHEKRLEKLQIPNEVYERGESDSSMAKSNRNTGTIYDDLTSDIEIK